MHPNSSYTAAPLALLLVAGLVLFGILLTSHFSLLTTVAHAAECQNSYGTGSAAPTGYGVAYNLFSTARERLVEGTDCTTTSATVQVGSGNAAQFVYNKGYYWTGSKWEEYTLTGTGAGSGWLTGKGTGNVQLPQTVTYVVGYVCQQQNGVWKCGCRDTSCTTAYWQLQAVKGPNAPPPSTGDGGGAGGDGGTLSGDLELNLNFDNRPLGEYTNAMMRADAGGKTIGTWTGGIYTAKWSIVDNGNGGKALRVGVGPQCQQSPHAIIPITPGKEYILETRLRFAPNFVTAQRETQGGKVFFGLQGALKEYHPSGNDTSGATDVMYGHKKAGQKLVDYTYDLSRPCVGKEGCWGKQYHQFGSKSSDWHTLRIRAKLNTPGQNDGIVQYWYDGEQTLSKTDLKFIKAGIDWNWNNARLLTTIGGPCNVGGTNSFKEPSWIDYDYFHYKKVQ